jgi:hypothetical protein
MLLVFLLQAGGWMLLFHGHQSAKERLRKDPELLRHYSVQTFHFSSEAYTALRVGEDEFRYEGQMYDVVSLHADRGVLIVYAYRDMEEESLLDEIRRLVANSHDTTGKTGGLLQQLLGTLYAIPPALQCCAPDTFVTIDFSAFRLRGEDSALNDVSTPPPDGRMMAG